MKASATATREYREAKRDKVRQLRARLAGLTDQEKQELTSRGLIVNIEGRFLSLHNTYMIYLQSNGTTPSVVGGYRQWKAAGKHVKKGEHGLLIFFPAGADRDQETGEVNSPEHYYTGTVFDISQVEDTEDEPAQAA